jgi:hypothetical protein
MRHLSLDPPPQWEPLPEQYFHWRAADGNGAVRVKSFVPDLQAAIDRYEIDVRRISGKHVPDFAAKWEWRRRPPGLFDGDRR